MPKSAYKHCIDEAIYKYINASTDAIKISSPKKEADHDSNIIVPRLNKSYVDRLEQQSRCKEIDLKKYDES